MVNGCKWQIRSDSEAATEKKNKFETNNRNQNDEMVQMCIAHAAAKLQRFCWVILNAFDCGVIAFIMQKIEIYEKKSIRWETFDFFLLSMNMICLALIVIDSTAIDVCGISQCKKSRTI